MCDESACVTGDRITYCDSLRMENIACSVPSTQVCISTFMLLFLSGNHVSFGVRTDRALHNIIVWG